MAGWEASFGGHPFKNARLLTKEEIAKKYPITDNSSIANLTREFVSLGYDILYGEKSDSVSADSWKREETRTVGALITAANIYNTNPNNIIVGVFTDLSEQNIVYAAVKQKHRFH